jgi:hypothetical protein
MFSLATWINADAWPTIVTDNPSTRGIGLAGVTGTDFGQRAAAPASFQRSTSRKPRSAGGWSGLKKRMPSKWSLGGPA